MNEISGFSQTEYLITFHSIIFGFVATMFLAGWGHLLRNRKFVKSTGNYLLFTGTVFLIMLIHWWNLYGRAEILGESLLQFVGALPYSIFFYFISVFAFGRIRDHVSAENKTDLSEIYSKYKNHLFGLLLGFFVYDLIVTLHNDALIFRVFAIGICLSGLLMSSLHAHKALMLFSIALISAYITLDVFDVIDETAIRKEYSKAEHLSIFISIIYGYVITIYFEGWGGLFKMKSRAFSTTQFLWSLFSFLFLIDIWWNSWSRNAFIGKDILHFIVFLLVPFVIYLIGVLLFPKTDPENYETHFFSNKRLFFSLFAILLVIQVVLSMLFTEHAGVVNYLRFCGVLLALVAIRINHLLFHKILVITAFALLMLKVGMTSF